MMPMGGNGGNGNGSGMTPDPDIMMPPTLETLFGTTDTGMRTTVGGVGRVVGSNAEVDGKDAILMIISETAIGSLLDDPDNATTGTKLLDEDATIDYSGARPTIKPNPASMTPFNARGTDNSGQSGIVYQPTAAAVGGSSDGSVVYIDDHAAVVLGYENSTDANMEITMVGEPLSFSRMPTTMDFSGTYSGFATAISKTNTFSLLTESRNAFNMVVGSTGSITSFDVNFGAENGMVAAMNIPIDITDGTFASDENSTVTFTAGSSDAGTINSTGASTSGTFLGQFHGMDAIGVTGAFHNSADAATTAPTVIGAFAGSKE